MFKSCTVSLTAKTVKQVIETKNLEFRLEQEDERINLMVRNSDFSGMFFTVLVIDKNLIVKRISCVPEAIGLEVDKNERVIIKDDNA